MPPNRQNEGGHGRVFLLYLSIVIHYGVQYCTDLSLSVQYCTTLTLDTAKDFRIFQLPHHQSRRDFGESNLELIIEGPLFTREEYEVPYIYESIFACDTDDESTMTSWEQFWQKTLTVDPKIGQKDGKRSGEPAAVY